MQLMYYSTVNCIIVQYNEDNECERRVQITVISFARIFMNSLAAPPQWPYVSLQLLRPQNRKSPYVSVERRRQLTRLAAEAESSRAARHQNRLSKAQRRASASLRAEQNSGLYEMRREQNRLSYLIYRINSRLFESTLLNMYFTGAEYTQHNTTV